MIVGRVWKGYVASSKTIKNIYITNQLFCTFFIISHVTQAQKMTDSMTVFN